MRKICVITGTRANYGRLKTVMNAIINHPELELKLIVTGMHLIPEFGYTVTEIEKDGYTIDARVDMHLSNDTGAGMCKSLGLGLIGMTQAIESIQPDMILILGDRDEDLAGAIIGAHMNIPVAHIHGGEVTGTIDESIRHATTKFSHIHFAATEGSKERLLKLGEIEDYVFNVGSPGLDAILNREYSTRSELFNKFNLDTSKKLIIVAQHPVTTQKEQAEDQMQQTMEAIKELGEQTLLIYPNADAGGREMISVIQQYENLDFLTTYRNINFEDYLNLLKYADVMVGNSSSGIMEAPSYYLPVINLGTRQDGREQSNNILNVNHDKNLIKQAIETCLYDETFIQQVNECVNPYGDGKTGKRIANILADIEINNKLIQKKIVY
ncbi:MAG: UDP-N-acetylglucosamine 2-epimerase [Clostridiales bacterium]|uniref:UDP-N-acetylglucosamine 2-epimerase (Hydrolyzing) n=1 Tax=Zhenhengia yiwuensis TaxID=2763666 RepID=A0A926EHB7_9FIRM|nr:UDP-N-acetylglucosamine 2-epimerase [Zhenhengia yiwuensis]MBC8578965.1 UDP-N-acetylglucosamine 2-epimerase (hydrolyzing) [Zhenhengia yiwuensis]MDU6359659.1 UDP-N-acetylglucosamine 2-epimerase [Clostridiales bacterium]